MSFGTSNYRKAQSNDVQGVHGDYDGDHYSHDDRDGGRDRGVARGGGVPSCGGPRRGIC